MIIWIVANDSQSVLVCLRESMIVKCAEILSFCVWWVNILCLFRSKGIVILMEMNELMLLRMMGVL